MKTSPKLEEIKAMVYACTQCGYCREKYSDKVYTELPAYRVCPVHEHTGGFEHHYARGKIQIAQGILEGRFPYSEELIELLYMEPDCKLCTWVCHAEAVLDPPMIWRAMRQDIVAAGLGPPKQLKKLDANIAERHNIFGGRPDRRSQWASDLNLPATGDTLYFAGCYASYTQSEIARATVAILRKAKLEVACLGDEEWCCGVVQFHDGSIALAKQMAEHNVEAINKSGAKRVVTACAECYKSLKKEYPQLLGKLPFEVVHISEVLAGLVRSGEIAFKEGLGEGKVTYHDPCHLGRYCNVYNEPREVLKRIPGIELVEMLRHREYAWCCGNGADLLRSVAPELAAQVAKDRIMEAREAGAEAIITACPRCVTSMRQAADGMKIYDLSVAVAKAMHLEF